MSHPAAVPGAAAANFGCLSAMVLWAVGFPAADILLESWGTLALLTVRVFLAVGLLLGIWALREGLASLGRAPWRRGMFIGAIGFGLGAYALLLGQKLSDAVTPAIAVAMMPVAGAALELLLDKRRLQIALASGIALALLGGTLATGARFSEGNFGLGALLCLFAVGTFAWATRATTRDLADISAIGRTTITLAGGFIFVLLGWLASTWAGLGDTAIGLVDGQHLILLFIFTVPALMIAQFLWIWSAAGLGILVASLHMNAVPFYVMVIVVLLLGAPWHWDQALGAALVAAGVLLAQLPPQRRSRRAY